MAYRFPGQRWDGGIRLYDDKARYDDPALARFIQPDPLVPEPGDPQSLNRYAYVNNNPLRYTDPSGRTVDAGGAPIGCDPRQDKCQGNPYWNSDQLGMDLFWDWYYEHGWSVRIYGPNAALTKDLRNDEGVQAAREQFYQDPEHYKPYRYRFNNPVQPIREGVQWATGRDKTGVGSVLGSYIVYIDDHHDGTITVRVFNKTGRESATRLLGPGPSIEARLKGVRSKSLKEWWPKSIFENKTRQQTGPSQWPWIGPKGWMVTCYSGTSGLSLFG